MAAVCAAAALGAACAGDGREPCGDAHIEVAEPVREASEHGTFEITYFEFRGRRVQLHDVAVARDGGVWYIDQLSACAGLFHPAAGTTQEFATGARGGAAHGIALDPSGGLWYAAAAGRAIGYRPPGEPPRHLPLPPHVGSPHSFSTGGGTAWFTADSAVGVASPHTGAVRVFHVAGHVPYDVVVVNSAAWISFPDAGALGRIDLAAADAVAHDAAAHDAAAHDTAAHDTAAHDTAAHDTAAHGAGARGAVTVIPLRDLLQPAERRDGGGAISPLRLSARHDEVVWFTDWRGSRIGRYDFGSRSLTVHPTYTRDGYPRSIAVDAQGIVWYYEEASGLLVRFDPASGVADVAASPVFARHMVYDERTGRLWLAGGTGVGRVDIARR